MIDVKLKNLDPNTIMQIVKELREQKLVQGKDFDFEYHQTKWDPVTGHGPIQEKHVIFKFYKDKLATWFILKYGS